MTKALSSYSGTIAKWGNSQAVRLTTDILRQAQIATSTPVRIIAERGRITIEPEKKKVDLNALLDKITNESGLELVNYGEPVGRERFEA